jgi:hypothetical protein
VFAGRVLSPRREYNADQTFPTIPRYPRLAVQCGPSRKCAGTCKLHQELGRSRKVDVDVCCLIIIPFIAMHLFLFARCCYLLESSISESLRGSWLGLCSLLAVFCASGKNKFPGILHLSLPDPLGPDKKDIDIVRELPVRSTNIFGSLSTDFKSLVLTGGQVKQTSRVACVADAKFTALRSCNINGRGPKLYICNTAC